MKDKKITGWHTVVGMNIEEMPQAAKDAEERYGDILQLSHPEPKNHPRMSIEARAAQFAPFAALTGYDNVIEDAVETVREDYSKR